MTSTAPNPHLDALREHTRRLVETAEHLDDTHAPSLCDGWTRGHVLTHLARNAEAIERLVAWAVTGTPHEMYPGGTRARDAAIDAGADRQPGMLAADVTGTAHDLDRVLGKLGGPLVAPEVEMRGGHRVPASRLPFLRLREVVFHHVDLDAGFGFDDVEPGLLREFLDDAVARLAAHPEAPSVTVRSTEGDTWQIGDGATTVTGTRSGLLLWLSRQVTSGVQGDLPDLPRGA